MLRDQAWFELELFSGNRAGDLTDLFTQEIKLLRYYSGLGFNHLPKRRSNIYVIERCAEDDACPVYTCSRVARLCVRM